MNITRFRLGVLTLVTIGIHGSEEHPLATSLIEKMYHFPPRKLETIIYPLSRKDFIRSVRGISGGYFLNTQKKITLADIAICLEEQNTSSKKELSLPILEKVLNPFIFQADNAFLASLSQTFLVDIIHESKKEAHLLCPEYGSDYII